jgi:phage-related protein
VASKTIKGITIEIGGDTTNLQKALNDVESQSNRLSGELKDINRLLKLDPGNTDLLAQKQKVLADAIDSCAAKLKTLKDAEKQVQAQFQRGEVSEAQVRALQREIVQTEQKMKGYQKAAAETEESLRGVGEESEKAEKSTGNLGSTLATAAKTGLAAVGAAAMACIAGLVAAAETTREYRTEMGKLDAAFTSSGHASSTARAAYAALQGVIGETDQSVEAAQQIALLADSEKEVSQWADLAAGVVGKFGDALQPETFFEAANETLKLGEATGAFTQMLEGTGVNVEKFNEGLAKCNTTNEKQAYLLKTAEQALGSAGEAYKKNNAEIIRANEANDKWMQSMSGIGAAVEPIITDVKLMGAALLNEAVPAVNSLADAFRGMLNGDEGASADFGAALSNMVNGLVQKIIELAPTIMEVGASLITTLVSSIVQQLPTLLTTGGQMIMQLLSGITSAIPNLLQSGADLITQFTTGLQNNLPTILQQGTDMLMNMVTGIANAYPSLMNQGLDSVQRFADTLAQNAPMLINKGFEMLSKLVEGIMNSLPTLIAKVPAIISTFANVINDNFPTILKKGAELILQIIKGIISAIPTLIANVPKIIAAIVDVWEAFNWLNLGKKAITFLKDGVLKMVSAVKGAGKTIVDTITNVIKNLPGNLMKLGKNAIDDLAGAIKNGWGTVKSAATTIFDGIVNFFKDLPGKMLQIGVDLVKGLWNGISDMSGWVIGKIQGFGESVLDGIKDFFGIASPSKEFAKIGRFLDEGLAQGLEDYADDPIKAAQRMAAGVLDGAQDINGLGLERELQQRAASRALSVTTAADSSMLGKLDRILAAIEKGQIITLDGKALVGGTVGAFDTALGQRRMLAARGAV